MNEFSHCNGFIFKANHWMEYCRQHENRNVFAGATDGLLTTKAQCWRDGVMAANTQAINTRKCFRQ
ncbi:hypothetical protein ACPSKX_05710 [Moritella viscosa]